MEKSIIVGNFVKCRKYMGAGRVLIDSFVKLTSIKTIHDMKDIQDFKENTYFNTYKDETYFIEEDMEEFVNILNKELKKTNKIDRK